MWTRIFSLLLSGLLLFGFSSHSNASTDYPATLSIIINNIGTYQSYADADAAAVAFYNSHFGTNTCTIFRSSSTGNYAVNCPYNGGNFSTGEYIKYTCPYGGTLNSSSPPLCIGGNPPPQCPANGTEVYLDSGPESSDPIHLNRDSNGCAVCSGDNSNIGGISVNICYGSDADKTKGRWSCPYVYGSCPNAKPTDPVVSSSAPAKPAAPSSCPPGKTASMAGGVAVCIAPDGTKTPAPPAPSSSGPCPPGQLAGTINNSTICYDAPKTTSGNTSSQTVVNTTNNTTTIVTTQVSCDGVTCTTTTGPASSPNAPPGTASGPVTKTTQSQDSYCAQNPKSPFCLGSKVAGSCATGYYATSDDPISLAAVKLAQLDCPADGSMSLGVSGTPFTINSSPLQSTVDAGPPKALSAGTCSLGVQTFQIGSMSVTLDLSVLCQYFSIMRALLIAFASVAWFRIVAGA